MSPPLASARAGVLSQIGDAIPDSAVRQWPLPQRTNSTVVENLANDDGTTNGGPTNTADSNYFDGYFEALDGTDDSLFLPYSEWNNQIQSKEWGFAYTLKTSITPSGSNQIMGAETGNNRIIDIGNLRLTDTNGNEVQADHGFDLGDGTRRRIFWVVSTDNPNNWSVYFNDSSQSLTLTTNSSFDASNITLGHDIAWTGQNNGGSLIREINADVDNMVLYDNPDRQDITDDYNLQPWS